MFVMFVISQRKFKLRQHHLKSNAGNITCHNKSEPECGEAAEVLRLTHLPPAFSCFSSIGRGKFPSSSPCFL